MATDAKEKRSLFQAIRFFVFSPQDKKSHDDANGWAHNLAVPNMLQVTRLKSYGAAAGGPQGNNKVAPEPTAGDVEAAEDSEVVDPEFEKNVREVMMAAAIDGLVNKALISALFLTFNIPAIMQPPLPVDTSDAAFMIFFIAAGFAIASGFYCIIAATFMANHAKAATLSQTVAVVFSDRLAKHMVYNHRVFLVQGLMTSTQVAAVCVHYMDNNWALWLCIGACALSLIMVSWTKKVVNSAWADALVMIATEAAEKKAKVK